MTTRSYIFRGLLALGITIGVNLFLNGLDTEGNQLAILPSLILAGGSLAASLLSNKGGGDGFSRGDLDAAIARRQGQIDTFRQELASSRAKLSARIGALQELTFKRFGGKAEAQFGTRGLQVTGGAFQSALAKEAANLQAEQDVAIAGQERADITAEQKLRTGLFQQRLGGLAGIGAIEGAAGLQRQQALGQLTGQLGSQALGGFADFLKRSRRPRAIVRGPEGGAGESGIKQFRTIVG